MKHGETSEITGAKTELELSLAKLDVYTPDSSTSSLTDDDNEVLPPHIIVIRRPDDGERPPPSSLTQANAKGSQPTLPPPPHTGDRQACAETTGPKKEPEEYIEAIEPKVEPKIVPSCPAPPNGHTGLLGISRMEPPKQFISHHGNGARPPTDAQGLGRSSGWGISG